MAWFAENWIALGTLLGVTVGAMATVWTARETRRMALLQKAATAFPEPAISAIAVEEFGEGRALIRVDVRNRADISLETIAVTAPWQAGLRFHPKVEALSGKNNGFSGPIPAVDAWPQKVPAPFSLGPATGTRRHQLILQVTIHRRAPWFLPSAPPLIRLEMQWRDHAVTKFSRQVTVTPKSTM